MKNKFNLRTFLTENKLTSNSKLLKEVEYDKEYDIAKSHTDELEDATFPVAEAFKKVGIDMSKDVHVHYQDGGPPGLGAGRLKDKGVQSAESVVKMLEEHRQKEIKEYEEFVQSDDGYEMEFPVMYEYYYYGGKKFTPEGKEFKLTYSVFEGESWDLFQEPSGVSENIGEGLKDVEDGRDIGGKIIEFADGGNVDINIDYQRGKTKDFKDVPVEKAIDIVNQYIDQNDLTQASTDETNRILQVDDGDTAIDITKAGMSEKKVQELKDVEDGRDIGGKIIEFADGGNVDINIDYQRGKTKDFKDVPVEKAIDIVNQYIDQNDLTQASTDETNRILQVDDGDTAIDITKAGMSEKKGKDHDGEIISYIADTYIQNAKDGDKAYAEFRDLNIRDAVQDIVGILQDPKHPLHGETKKEYQIVSRDKARGLFENKMKNNFDLKNFLTENKLTSNSRLAEGDIPFYNSSKEEFPYLADYPVDQAFQKAGVDMSKPVTLTNVNIHGYDQEEDSEEHDATKAASSLEARRKEGIAQALKDYGKEWDDLRQTSRGVMPDYAFDEAGYDETPDGHDFKLVIEFEETDYVIVSQKS